MHRTRVSAKALTLLERRNWMSQAGLRANRTSDVEATISHDSPGHTLHRGLTWKDAFWVTSGVPAGVLFTIGGVCATIGQPAWAIWIAAITMGLVQSATYAEISGLFPHKSGGASVYGAIGWVRYSKLIAPVSVWCNWLAWSPMLALGCGSRRAMRSRVSFPPTRRCCNGSSRLRISGSSSRVCPCGSMRRSSSRRSCFSSRSSFSTAVHRRLRVRSAFSASRRSRRC